MEQSDGRYILADVGPRFRIDRVGLHGLWQEATPPVGICFRLGVVRHPLSDDQHGHLDSWRRGLGGSSLSDALSSTENEG